MKPCPKCGEQIKETLKFCVYCGCNIAQEEAKGKAKFCGECGAQIEDGMKFCGECGAKVDAPAQNDDPWADVLDEQKSDDPWANFADSECAKERIEKAQVDTKLIEQDFKKGVELYWQQNYSSALPFLLPMAEKGDADAQFKVGYCYGSAQQYDKAMEWYLQSAEQGYALAMNNIGWMYQSGMGVEANDAVAFDWYKKSAENNDVLGCENLAFCYQSGRGTTKDLKKAFDWWLKSAKTGRSNAQEAVGTYYHLGWGIKQDFVKAAEWYCKAIENGNMHPLHELTWSAYDILNGRNGAVQNEGLGFYFTSVAAEKGCEEAWNNLGYCYFAGQGTKKDLQQAKYWFDKALDAGIDDAADWLQMIEQEEE